MYIFLTDKNYLFFSEGGKECPHFSKSFNLGKLKKALQKTGIKTECTACQKAEKNSPQVVEDEVIFTLLLTFR